MGLRLRLLVACGVSCFCLLGEGQLQGREKASIHMWLDVVQHFLR